MSEQILKIVAVALGGAFGSAARYSLGLIPNPFPFPLWTFAVNILGALLIGFIIGQQSKLGATTFVGLKTGFCGGFTTFSTFSQETLVLFENGRYITGALYALLSLVLCVLGVALGQKLAG